MAITTSSSTSVKADREDELERKAGIAVGQGWYESQANCLYDVNPPKKLERLPRQARASSPNAA
jgi:hypothetical protein